MLTVRITIARSISACARFGCSTRTRSTSCSRAFASSEGTACCCGRNGLPATMAGDGAETAQLIRLGLKELSK